MIEKDSGLLLGELHSDSQISLFVLEDSDEQEWVNVTVELLQTGYTLYAGQNYVGSVMTGAGPRHLVWKINE